jgi:hypothetical protein
MSSVQNIWLPVEDDPSTTQLHISGVYNIVALVSTADVEALKGRSWCYEQAKGNVYTMDFSMELSKLLGIASPRIYLWKYIVYLHTHKIAKAWRRTNVLDYRFNHGSVQYIDSVPVATIAGI